MSEINERLRAIMNHYNYNYNSFGKELGYSDVAISKLLKGKNKPKFDFLQAILNRFPDISPEWLLTGKGEMLRDTEQKSMEIRRLDKEKVASPTKEIQDIPLYNIEAQAGLDGIFAPGRQVPVDMLRIPFLPKVDGAVFVTGDSMYPLLKSGDIVVFRRIHNIPQALIWGEMYLLDLDINGDTLIVLKYVHPVDDKHIKLVSQNEHHADKIISISSIRAAAHIVASIRFNTMV